MLMVLLLMRQSFPYGSVILSQNHQPRRCLLLDTFHRAVGKGYFGVPKGRQSTLVHPNSWAIPLFAYLDINYEMPIASFYQCTSNKQRAKGQHSQNEFDDISVHIINISMIRRLLIFESFLLQSYESRKQLFKIFFPQNTLRIANYHVDQIIFLRFYDKKHDLISRLQQNDFMIVFEVLPLENRWKINRIQFQMQSLRYKTPYAYAKVCKSEPKGTVTHSKDGLPVSSRSKKDDQIYEELLNELDLDGSQYIRNICKKNQLKMKRKQEEKEKPPKVSTFKNITNIMNESSQRSIKGALKQNSCQNVSHKSSKSSIKGSKKEIMYQAEHQSSRKMVENSLTLLNQSQQSSNRYFLNDLDLYISKLNENQHEYPESYSEKNSLNKNRSQDQRQFRRTVEVSSYKKKKKNIEAVSLAKYSKLLDKLHQQLIEKQALQYKIQCKDTKIVQMKSTIQQMYGQIGILRQELLVQREEKQKYSTIAQEFASKVHKIRTNSKEKHYIPHHQKRNSHIPSSSNFYQNELVDFFNKTGWQDGKSTIQKRLDYDRTRDREEVTTLKKKGMHKFKMSEIFMQGSESEKQRASIYHDSYI